MHEHVDQILGHDSSKDEELSNTSLQFLMLTSEVYRYFAESM